ncbi:GMC family oxidoreductase [Conexibacter stalactiti]|uniref:GMC family oxidoreductase n=1 Tax=Conexibacter stalactiti TaxID=1940611 RepID=A0ABU4HZN0_9ACTN|nr:GMC family oxidoreductase [Conexibacter stalactiti]MDW5598791.1 GMC family oxidoreductase [Conexibacter stalactiti]MEC5039433.1 GMC family oxidoreductase [Conexibacter stalactiti]
MSAAHLTADVLVIGSGPSGAALSWRLASQGADVLCLEQGDWMTADDLPKSHEDWDARGRHGWNPSPGKRRDPVDYPVTNLGADPVDAYVYNAVGGSANGYGGHFWRLVPSDFRTKTLDGFGVDWPISYDELAPYYDLNERELGVSGLAGDPTAPPRTAPPLPPADLGRLGRRWIEGFERLGWYWWPHDQAIVTRPYRDRGVCTNRGFCTLGCPNGALSTPGNTYWPAAFQHGARLQTRARVREVLVGADGRATGALYYDGDGELREARAKVVVICANGIGTPRLLLMSRSPAHPDGLANSSGLVGRNLMVHVQSVALGRFDDHLDTFKGARGSVIGSRHFYETDPARDFKRGFILSAMRGNSPLNIALGGAPWGADHHGAVERAVGHDGAVWVCGDDAPEEVNRVELDDDKLDAWGLPGVRTHYRLSDNSKRIGQFGLERAKELLSAAGARDVIDTGLSPILGWHLLGTARMGHDPATSVVDASNRAHDVDNLYVVDGSSMPTGGSINPTNTLQALALRTADQIWSRRRELTETPATTATAGSAA